MTYSDAMALARQLADQYQQWYEVHTNGDDYIVLQAGDTADGYDHYMSISPRIRISNG